MVFDSYYDRWTPDQDAELLDLYRLGVREKQIGKQLGRTERGVQRRIARLYAEGLITNKERRRIKCD